MKLLTNIAPVNMLLLTVAVMALVNTAGEWAHAQQVLVPSGSFHSVMPEVEGEPIPVDSFYMDATAVTNEQFEAFTAEHEQWQSGEPPAVFANSDYLKHWSGPRPNYPNDRQKSSRNPRFVVCCKCLLPIGRRTAPHPQRVGILCPAHGF
ncbi:MAG: SUMF1/EgtB/PvdO family nonheme iron enzyme [Balneolaceae bacterium]|nr:SUMF1/EgtB/PvdO family nonheme iron enzyme [Balneolaceae bacterium]